MVPNTNVEEGKSATICAGNDERKFSESKASCDKPYDQELNETAETKSPANSLCKKSSKTDTELEESGNNTNTTADTENQEENIEKLHEKKLEASLGDEKAKKKEEQKMDDVKGTPKQEQQPDALVAETHNDDSEVQKSAPVARKPSDMTLPFAEGKPVSGIGKTGKSRADLHQRRPSEIPKLKSLQRGSRGTHQKPNISQSKLPVKTTQKEFERKRSEKALDRLKIKRKTDSMKAMMKSFKVKKEPKTNEKVKQALAEDFNYLVPLYEKQFKKISDVWVNTIYCSLTIRTNLVKLLFNAFPNINKSQFYTEDDRLLECIAHAKSCTKMEAENLIKLIKNLVANREKTKEDYAIMVANREIADCYNHDWRRLIKKMTGLGEEAKHLQIETPQMQRKKEVNEVNTNEKIRRMEVNLCKKEDEIKKLLNQLNLLKQKENTCKDNILLKIPDYKEIRADVQSLSTVQKEYDELKAKYLYQNYTYEKKIRDLENLVEEKKKILEKERDMKKQLQLLLAQLQAHQKRLTTSIGREQVDYVLGRSLQERHKRREQLWSAAVKLVLRGFVLQMERLERDRNKMLLEVQSSDFENFTDTVIIIQKDNFIKSIKQQMNDLQKVCTCQNVKSA